MKVVTPNTLIKIKRSLVKKKFVFTNGCFDLLHVGHIRYLKKAKSLGDILVVGLNSDRSVQLIKGPNRPIISQDERVEVLSALEMVDYIIMFDNPSPLELIKRVRPDILVKGEDWKEENIIGGKEVKEYGGKVVRVKFTKPNSTSEIIERIIRRNGE
jgi:D-beta-D-heptose 7-phosphate kinase/D-beta-D-heptose 1-phosphate adenosyltransferase